MLLTDQHSLLCLMLRVVWPGLQQRLGRFPLPPMWQGCVHQACRPGQAQLSCLSSWLLLENVTLFFPFFILPIPLKNQTKKTKHNNCIIRIRGAPAWKRPCRSWVLGGK